MRQSQVLNSAAIPAAIASINYQQLYILTPEVLGKTHISLTAKENHENTNDEKTKGQEEYDSSSLFRTFAFRVFVMVIGCGLAALTPWRRNSCDTGFF
jgi:hypothetical protein